MPTTQVAPRAAPVVLAILLLALVHGACGPDDGQAEPVNPLGAGHQVLAAPPHWELAAVSPELLDRIQEELGRRAGVRVVRVEESGDGARAGIAAGDVLLSIDGAIVGSPDAVNAALVGGEGPFSLTVLRIAEDGAWSIPTIALSLSAVPDPVVPAPEPPQPSTPSPTPIDSSPRGIVQAFFDMLDFSRTEGWGRKSQTSEATRQQAEVLLRQHLPRMDRQTRTAVTQIPEAWGTLRSRWAEADEGERQKQRTFWKTRLLLPNPLLPPQGALATFRSEAGGHAFEHPADWVVAQGHVDDTGLLYLGPAGTQTTWEMVVDPATSPPGVVFAISPTDEGIRATSTPEEGARYIAQNFVTARAPDMKEVAAFRLGTGALVAYVGRWPGATDESFCWVAAMPFGNDKFIAGRFSGPVAQAETLLPAFSVILATSEVTPPDDLANLQVELAASIIGNAVVNTGWSH